MYMSAYSLCVSACALAERERERERDLRKLRSIPFFPFFLNVWVFWEATHTTHTKTILGNSGKNGRAELSPITVFVCVLVSVFLCVCLMNHYEHWTTSPHTHTYAHTHAHAHTQVGLRQEGLTTGNTAQRNAWFYSHTLIHFKVERAWREVGKVLHFRV